MPGDREIRCQAPLAVGPYRDLDGEALYDLDEVKWSSGSIPAPPPRRPRRRGKTSDANSYCFVSVRLPTRAKSNVSLPRVALFTDRCVPSKPRSAPSNVPSMVLDPGVLIV